MAPTSFGRMNALFSSPDLPALRVAIAADIDAMAALIHSILQSLELSPTRERIVADLTAIIATGQTTGEGAWVLTDIAGRIIGTVALRRVDKHTVELQKMYLDPRWRGRGLGRRLLDHGWAAAHDFGYQRMVLDTSERMTTALAMYRARGFTPIDRRDPWSHCDLAFERKLNDS